MIQMAQIAMFKSARINGEGVLDVDVQEVHERREDVLLVDVRRPDEYTGELGHILGSKLLTLETDFAEGAKALPRDIGIVFVCRSGGRSSRAAAHALSLGFESVFNMSGGMLEWNKRGLPTSK